MRLLACMAAICLGCAAEAAQPSAQLVGATTLIPGASAPPTEIRTLTDTVSVPGVSTPRLRVGLSGTVRLPLRDDVEVWARWGLWRDQALCDTCGEGRGPGWLGSELLGSTDATVAVQRRWLLGEPGEDEPPDDAASPWLSPGSRSRVPWLLLRADAVLPASRDALVCNPMLAAPGAGATFGLPAKGSTVRIGVSGSRPIYLESAVPVGRCAPPLRGQSTVRTLTGAVEPTPWGGERPGALNPTMAASASLTWADPQAVLPGAPERLFSALSVGLAASRVARDPDAAVRAASGTVAVGPSSNPVRTAIPWSIQAGLSATDRLDLALTLGDQLPVLSADPGAALRAQTTTTSITASVAGRF